MKPEKQPIQIYQSRKGITLIDGFYLARNPRTHLINVISVAKGRVYIHDIIRQMDLQSLIQMDAIGQIEIFETLKLMEVEKYKNKKNKNDE